MYRCQLCNRVSRAGERATKVVTERRPAEYPSRGKAQKGRPGSRSKFQDDPGGAGYEIAKERIAVRDMRAGAPRQRSRPRSRPRSRAPRHLTRPGAVPSVVSPLDALADRDRRRIRRPRAQRWAWWPPGVAGSSMRSAPFAIVSSVAVVVGRLIPDAVSAGRPRGY